ncbi:MAG: 16S rRNA (cytosine(1402)-N(4))-methyltransferase [Planctomycetes bacterium HGW-Planctomycetes-1]|nr:MAG: 16S rRNA (cytosine(1402)-N(4))-methyltransferase [Planctomycetes bacterium HGW-Planctomycetes-1]
MNSEQTGNNGHHHRRPRYSGTHPKNYRQKYKEHNITAYPELKTHLRAKGKTPAGSHIPVLLEEVLGCLKPKAGQIVADCTVGYGGHTSKFIKHIGPTGKLIAFDVDGAELERTRKRLGKVETPVSFYHSNFAGIAKALKEEKLDGFDIIFADLGVSSMQIDNPDRGISYKNEGPLDMRMDDRLKRTGADLLKTLCEEELAKAFWELSDEPDCKEIARTIVAQRGVQPITTVSQLVRLVFAVKGLTVNSWKKKQRSSKFGSLHPAARTFQALRIMVNDELGSLKELLRLAPYCLRPGGRIGIISFHSGEDRLVKQSFRDGVETGIYQSAAKNAIVPRRQEIKANPRCASAKFRWAMKKEVKM